MVALVLGLVATGCTSGSTSEPSAADGSPAPRTLLDVRGTGLTDTKPFEADAAWDVTYTYDCSSAGAEPEFALLVQREGQPVNVLARNEDAAGASGERSARWPHGGTYSLKVDSPCAWTVRVVEG